VLFDSTGTPAPAGVDAFRQLTYAYDFGDARGLTWALDGEPKNTQVGGPLAAHVFDVPGTFTVKVHARNPDGTSSDASVAVSVADPDAVYAGTKTLCVSLASNYTGCPAGAAQGTALPSAPAWSGLRVLLHRGETFGAISIQDGNAGVQVGAYGTGAKPTVASVGVGNWRPATAAFATDVTVMDLNVLNGMSQSLGSRVLFYRNDVHVATGSGGIAMVLGDPTYWRNGDPYRTVPQSAFYNAREIFFVENDALGVDTVSALEGVWGSASQSALLGNTYGRTVYHSVRLCGFHKGVIAHNEMQGISSDGNRLALKLHSNGLNPYGDSSINDLTGVGGWASSQVVIANNLFGNAADNNAWTVGIEPQNNQYAEGVEDVILENNRFARGSRTSTDLTLGGRRLTYRGNTAVGGGPITEGIGFDGPLPPEWKGPYFTN
jgi:hypothetical protein